MFIIFPSLFFFYMLSKKHFLIITTFLEYESVLKNVLPEIDELISNKNLQYAFPLISINPIIITSFVFLLFYLWN